MFVHNGNRPPPDVTAPARGGAEAPKATVPMPGTGVGRSAAVDVPQAAVQPVAEPPSSEQLKKAVEELNRAMRQSNRNLEFSVDDASNRVIVRLTDAETGEVIRQIPSEETLAISRAIGEFQQGMLLTQKV